MQIRRLRSGVSYLLDLSVVSPNLSVAVPTKLKTNSFLHRMPRKSVEMGQIEPIDCDVEKGQKATRDVGEVWLFGLA
jgi:hypothetical protein